MYNRTILGGCIVWEHWPDTPE